MQTMSRGGRGTTCKTCNTRKERPAAEGIFKKKAIKVNIHAQNRK